MAERNNIMANRQYVGNFVTKCVFISETHAIFDFTIRRGLANVICEGNVIVDNSLNCNYESIAAEGEANFVNEELPQIIERCLDRAKFIFNKN